jgi:hypothetical protein
VGSRRSPRRLLVAVGVAGLLIGVIIVVGTVASEPSPCCSGAPYVRLYDHPLNRLDAVLARGDGQAFAALAQDPLLQRPSVIANRGDFAYRAQRPVWGVLAWMLSLGQPDAVAWVLALLTVVSCGAACAVGALLLADRHVSPWWSLLIPLVALETLREFTPELLAFALLGLGLWWWQRDRHRAATVVFCVAALTRETMLVGVGALALWTLSQAGPRVRTRVRSVLPLATPFAVYAAWVVVVTARVGASPLGRSQGRLGVPGVGLVQSLERSPGPAEIVGWFLLAVGVCVSGLLVRRADVLTWVATAFLGFGLLLGPSVWLTNAGYTRTLLPLFILGAVPVLGALRERVRLPGPRFGARLVLTPGDASRPAP